VGLHSYDSHQQKGHVGWKPTLIDVVSSHVGWKPAPIDVVQAMSAGNQPRSMLF